MTVKLMPKYYENRKLNTKTNKKIKKKELECYVMNSFSKRSSLVEELGLSRDKDSKPTPQKA